MAEEEDEVTQTIKITRLANEEIVKEVDLAEARRMVEEACIQGKIAVNIQTGEVIDEVTSDIKEIMIIEVLGGG